MRDEPPTADELAFFDTLSGLLPGVQDWYYKDPDGDLWMIASYDLTEAGVVRLTLRCDFDGARLLGGRSPGFLNWDDGVRAEDAGVDTRSGEGLDELVTSPLAAARAAAAWFGRRIKAAGSAPARP